MTEYVAIAMRRGNEALAVLRDLVRWSNQTANDVEGLATIIDRARRVLR